MVITGVGDEPFFSNFAIIAATVRHFTIRIFFGEKLEFSVASHLRRVLDTSSRDSKGLRGHFLVWVVLHDHVKAMCRGEIG